MLPVAGTASGGFAAGFLGTSAATTATTSFVSGALIGGGAGLASGFTSGLGNGLIGGQNFGQALWSGTKNGLIGGLSGAAIGGLVGGISAARQGRDFWDGFDYQKALDDAVAREGINNPNSKFLVANKKNARLVNNTYNTNLKVSGNKMIYNFIEDGIEYINTTEYALNTGTKSKGNITLVSKQTIRNKAYFDLTDVIRHETTHQFQVLEGMTNVRSMEIGAYMTNLGNPATRTTVSKVFNILVNDWNVNSSTLWEVMQYMKPHGAW